jgi:isoleucyl-tRNA synthetase
MPNWKDTLNLPNTGFRMKANLPVHEPEIQEHWEQSDLYGQIRKQQRGKESYILHDGPPYANGRIHLGHALNKILKDFIVKSRTMAGFDAPYIPGWDCHGLPIELQVDRQLGKKKRAMSTADIRRACRDYASKHVDIMRAEFKRLGVLGNWDEPYLTMDYSYQASIVRVLGNFVDQGLVYRGKKPVHWCISCRTALAEAEVEHDVHRSPAIYVEFSLKKESRPQFDAIAPSLAGKSVSVLIWTTTPWTIPSNLAIAFHPELTYGVYEQTTNAGGSSALILAEDLASRVEQETGHVLGKPIATCKGRELESLQFHHPLYERDSLAVLADYVTTEQGTGAVHTAPGHGTDDFNTGTRYGLEIYAPVGPDGKFTPDVELFANLKIFDSNPKVEEALLAQNRLWHRDKLDHSYPHCWRCHKPVIFLATSQWFVAMDTQAFRQRALSAIEEVEWFPSWGKERIHNMVENRPDWCISRQRSWGVPIPALYCTSCHEATLTKTLTDRAAALFETHGADAWYEHDLSKFLPHNFTCPSCGNGTFEREQDILDVWFDSGSSHEAVLGLNKALTWPANLYLEGSDQHRGWFHSSLLVGLGTRDAAPYKQVLTHGFVVDEDGRKMSKSLGNVIEPNTIIKRHGAEILRLWAAMVDYREEMRLGQEILDRVVEAYRKIRNTLRIMIANLYDFDPSTDTIPHDQLEEVDRYALARYGETGAKIIGAYERYDFKSISHTLNQFLTVEISAFYIDVSKDRLYTYAARSKERRSAQTALHTITDGLARLLAPLLPVTTEDLWHFLPGPRTSSVHLSEFPNNCEALIDDDLLTSWKRLLALREHVNRQLERLRQEKVIGTSLEATVSLRAGGITAILIESYKSFLPTLFITSNVVLEQNSPEDASELIKKSSVTSESSNVFVEQNDDGQYVGAALIEVERTVGSKCNRCWRYVGAVSVSEPRGLCSRCLEALAEVN